jgi:hypothetical protein
MIWLFTCTTEKCIHNENPVRMVDPINPVLCGACFKTNDAVQTEESAPEAPSEE